MAYLYSNDNGASWEGPLDDEEIAMLRSAGVITDSTMMRKDTPAPSGTTAEAPAANTAAPQEITDIYLMVLNEKKGPFTQGQVEKMLAEGQLTPKTPMWHAGMADWGSVSDLGNSTVLGSKLISNITGLGGFEGFSFARFIGDIFKHHTSDEMTDFFCSGSRKTTPTLAEINPIWPSPWIFARLILLSMILYFGFSLTLEKFEGSGRVVPGLIFVGSFAIPFCTLILFTELNIQRNISFNRIITAFLLGGLLSLIITFFISVQIGNYESYVAGAVEEPAKLLAAIVIGRKFADGKILTGIVIGAAVGAGFAAFESAGYALDTIFSALGHRQNPIAAMHENLEMRGILSPFGHVVWTAITSGAFWLAMSKKLPEKSAQAFLNLDCLADARFLRIAWIPIVLHMLWNGMFPGLYSLGYSFFIILGVVAWIVVLLLVQAGIKQIQNDKKAQGLM